MSRAVTLNRRVPQLLAGALVIVLAAAALFLPARAVVEPLRETLFSPVFPLVLAALYLVRPFLGLPIVVLSALVGYRYGVWVGVPVALAGAVTTSLPAYLAGRRYLRDGALFERFTAGSGRFFAWAGDLRGVVAARLVPTPAEAISGAAGAASISLPVFVAGTAIGELPWTVAAVYAGAAMTTYAPSVTTDRWVAGLAVALGLLLFARPVYDTVTNR